MTFQTKPLFVPTRFFSGKSGEGAGVSQDSQGAADERLAPLIDIEDVEALSRLVESGCAEAAEAVAVALGQKRSGGRSTPPATDPQTGRVEVQVSPGGAIFRLSPECLAGAGEMLRRERKRARRIGLVLDEQ